jgi:hypothetical protein
MGGACRPFFSSRKYNTGPGPIGTTLIPTVVDIAKIFVVRSIFLNPPDEFSLSPAVPAPQEKIPALKYHIYVVQSCMIYRAPHSYIQANL